MGLLASFAVLAVTIQATSPAAGGDNTRPALASGSRVRLDLRGDSVPLAGRLESSDPDFVVVRPDGKGLRRVRWEAIDAVALARRRVLLGVGAGFLSGVAGGAMLSGATHEPLLDDAVLGGLIALPAAAVGVAVGGGEHPARNGAVLGACLDAVGLGIVLGGWCAAWDHSASDSCFLEAALLGAAFGALSGGVAAHVSRRHWTRVWARRAAVGIVPAKGYGAALVVRLAF